MRQLEVSSRDARDRRASHSARGTSAMNPAIEALHRRLRNAMPEAGDLERFATAIGVDGEDGLELCREALGGDLEAAMQLWRRSLPDRPLRIRADHTLTAARLCAHLLKEISEGPPSPEIPLG